MNSDITLSVHICQPVSIVCKGINCGKKIIRAICFDGEKVHPWSFYYRTKDERTILESFEHHLPQIWHSGL